MSEINEPQPGAEVRLRVVESDVMVTVGARELRLVLDRSRRAVDVYDGGVLVTRFTHAALRDLAEALDFTFDTGGSLLLTPPHLMG